MEFIEDSGYLEKWIGLCEVCGKPATESIIDFDKYCVNPATGKFTGYSYHAIKSEHKFCKEHTRLSRYYQTYTDDDVIAYIKKCEGRFAKDE